MKVLLFGGSIFPNQYAIESRQSLSNLLYTIVKRFLNCYDCNLEWISVVVIFLLLISIFYWTLNHNKNKKTKK